MTIKEVINFPYLTPPKPGTVKEIRDGIFWAQMPLPMLIDHVNVYILEGANELTIVDTGLNFENCRSAWLNIIKNNFSTKPITKVVITHHHPDHIGLLGWFCQNFGVEVYASRTSWLLARMLFLDKQNKVSNQAKEFWVKAGMHKQIFEERCNTPPFNFSDVVSEFPVGFNSLKQGDEIYLSDKKWRIEIGNGHAPDHVVLWGVDLPIVFSGDQVIPGISSNLGVYPTEPLLDTVGAWLNSCDRLLKISERGHFVLPGHKLPFYGLSVRLRQLIDNHLSALNRIEKKLTQGSFTAVDLFEPIFKKEINKNEYGLALAEAVGHVNYFRERNCLEVSQRDDGALLFKMK